MQIEQHLNIHSVFTERHWLEANRDIAAKILTECLYEELLQPDLVETTYQSTQAYRHYRLQFKEDCYYFTTKVRRFFGFERVLADSIRCENNNHHIALIDAYRLILNLNQAIGVKDHTAAYAMREFANTLVADMHQLASKKLTNKVLLESDEVVIESQLIAHPWIIANKGRLGFSYDDYLQYAPEVAPSNKLLWIAVSRGQASFHAVNELSYEKLIQQELDPDCLTHFAEKLTSLALKPSDYFYMPVHPWQWTNEIVTLFCHDIVLKNIVLLGHSKDDYQPQQSIRTFSNRSTPTRRYVKLPISILNTSVYRGLPPERVKIAPQLSQWLLDEVAEDPFLKHKAKLILLGEVATINYDHPVYAKMPNIPYQFREKLAVVYRESIHTKIAHDERCIPLSALLHFDTDNKPFIGEIIQQSGLTTAEWIQQFLKVTITPLVHVLYKFGFVFSPHGQNALLVLKNNQPSCLAVKDFVDDANICVDPLPEQANLPEALDDILASLEGPILIQWIQSGLFVCVFRYLTEILVDHLNYSEIQFWQQARKVIIDYQAQFEVLSPRFAAFDLLRPVFPKLCLNRVRLIDKGYSDDAERPSAAVASMLENPLACVSSTTIEKDTLYEQ